ncbi:3-hydroxybutyrate dehydrogenase [uncultured Alsobacter sp.]|uniref:3-hydroxybutyrate dehydrogenase n=1 Tax=uncultured Alsobacter sp. TaxID=1748258 RepID=UPI0025DDF1E5|nr:3-hydroxybutyrate dehydrogenase [uncultured Alsobacter sp.]
MNAQPTSTTSATRALAGRTALVTGSTSGIGLGIARALAAAGANIVVNGLGDRDAIARTCDEIRSDFAVEVLHAAADLTDATAIEGMMADALQGFGGVDILVNNAGVQHVSALESFPPSRWDVILALNLTAAFHTTRLVLGAMRRRGYGRIINVASAHGLVASPFKSAYVAAKHGLVGLTKVTALETAESPITCNAICPGYVWTPLVEAQINDQARTHGIPRDDVVRNVLLAQQPNKRFATVEEIGALALFLASDAAGSITGAALPVDGGWTAH